MDKEKLHYLVTPGTNERVLLTEGKPFMGLLDAVEKYRKKWCKDTTPMSIKKYEDTYTDKDSK